MPAKANKTKTKTKTKRPEKRKAAKPKADAATVAAADPDIKTGDEPVRKVRMDCRIHERIMRDCEAGAGLETPSDYWMTNLRRVLAIWVARGGQIDDDVATADSAARRTIALHPEVSSALAREADRLTKRHGRRYQPQEVMRLVWEQMRLTLREETDE